jgi:hypothetical protein
MIEVNSIKELSEVVKQLFTVVALMPQHSRTQLNIAEYS